MEQTQTTAAAPVTTASPTSVNYANFGRRLLAVLIDAILLGIIGVIVSLPFTVIGAILNNSTSGGMVAVGLSSIGSLINLIIGFIYYVYFIGKNGQTLGKKAMGIKVVRLDGVGQIGYVNAFLRESVGKFISGIVIGLGYLWMLWDPQKQTWHDKIVRTIVVKI